MIWKPKGETRELLDFCLATIKSVPYKSNLRWLFYRALQSGLLKDKGIGSVHKFDYALSRARKEFYDEWTPDILEDSVRQGFWKGEFSAGYDIQLDSIEEQENYAQVWFEAYAMFQQFTHYTQSYRLSLVPFRGDCSIPLKWELAKKLEKISKTYDKPIKILYFGDYDLKGFQILEAALNDIKAWCKTPFNIERVGLTLEQVKEYGIPENPDHPGAYQWEALNDVQAGSLITNSLANLIKPISPHLEEQEKRLKDKINSAMVTILQEEGVIE